MNERKVVLLTLALASILLLKASDKSAVSASESGDRLANKTKPVQVYILMGQSNMIGFGKVEPGKRGPQGSLSHAVKNEGKYAYLIEDSGNWTVRSDVRNVRVMGSGTGTTRSQVSSGGKATETVAARRSRVGTKRISCI